METATDMIASGERVTVPAIAKRLGDQGLYVPQGGTHLNSMHQWLTLGGVFSADWRVDRTRYETIMGASESQFEAFAGLTQLQRNFAIALARSGIDESPSNHIARYAEDLYGDSFPQKGLPQEVLFQLRDAGLITCEKTTAGRGAKPYIVRPTELLRRDVTESLLIAAQFPAGPAYRRLSRMSLPQIIEDLRSSSTHKKGIALEALAFHMARLLDLQFVEWRLRSRQSSGAEVDLVVEGTRLIFSRWQIQCKNTSSVSIDDVAKEVGLAFGLKSNVILVITTGRFSRTAREYSDQVMRDTNFNIILLDGKTLSRVVEQPPLITGYLNDEALRVKSIKGIMRR